MNTGLEEKECQECGAQAVCTVRDAIEIPAKDPDFPEFKPGETEYLCNFHKRKGKRIMMDGTEAVIGA